MNGHSSNDNDAPESSGREPDAHGQAAMLLVESLIHGLIERNVLSVANAVEIVETAANVMEDIRRERDAPATLLVSAHLLQAIIASLRIDLKT